MDAMMKKKKKKHGDIHYSVPNGPLTVGQLMQFLVGVDPQTQVVLVDGDWYTNVETVVIPGTEDTSEYSAITLGPGEEVNSRQF